MDKSKWKWLLVPPALAIVLVLGPLGGQAEQSRQPATGRPAASAPQRLPKAPEMPGAVRLVSSLVGVLLLGGAAVMLMARIRRGGAGEPGHVRMRQALRLPGKASLCVVEFDGRVFLLGAADGAALSVLASARDADPEAEAVDASEPAESEDEGAVPRDLLQPRPRRTHKPPRSKGKSVAAEIEDFRKLLRKARVHAEA